MIFSKKVELQELMSGEKLRPLTDAEVKFFYEFVAVFGPISACLDIIQGEDSVNAGYLHVLLESGKY